MFNFGSAVFPSSSTGEEAEGSVKLILQLTAIPLSMLFPFESNNLVNTRGWWLPLPIPTNDSGGGAGSIMVTALPRIQQWPAYVYYVCHWGSTLIFAKKFSRVFYSERERGKKTTRFHFEFIALDFRTRAPTSSIPFSVTKQLSP